MRIPALLVLLTRLVVPNPRRAQVTEPIVEPEEATVAAEPNAPLPIAA